jgi:ATP-binding cassette, subfamily B, bacterial
MKNKVKYFAEAVRLVWQSAPGWTLANIIISVIRSVLPLLLIWLLKGVIDGITAAAAARPGEQIENLMWPIVAVVLVWFADEAFSDISNLVRKKQSTQLEAFMYGLLHSKAIRLDLINFERPEYFDTLARASREAPWRPNSILNNLVSLLRGLISLALMTGILTTLNWKLAVLLIVVNIPGVWLRFYYSSVLYNFQREQTPEARKSAYFNWLLTGDRPSRELRLFGLGNYFRILFSKSFMKTKEEELNIIRKRTLIEIVSDLFKAAAVLVTLLFIARETIIGHISFGKMAMFLLAFRQGMVYIRELLGSVGGLYEDSLFIGDIFEFLNLKENIVALQPEIVPVGLNKSLSVENLSFTYPGNNSTTINNVSFEIKKGEIVALVGPNGAGKSTLAKLMCRLYDPEKGSVMLDGADIRHIDPDKFRKLLSVVFQDFMLYNMEAGENIRLGNIDNDDASEKVIMAAKASGIDEMISSLPGGYSAPVGNLFDDSRELSWGEWQKLALARALFRDAPLLILDEPSSSLDADTEYEIFSHFREMLKGRTSVLISHRFTNVSLADRIIVLDNGSIAETGTHEELMKKKGRYFSMYSKQAGMIGK